MQDVKVKTSSFDREIVMGAIFRKQLSEIQKSVAGVTSVMPYKDIKGEQLIRYKKNGVFYYMSVIDFTDMTQADGDRIEKIIKDK